MYQVQTPKQGPARATLKQARDTVPTTYRDALALVPVVSTARDPLPLGTEWADCPAACAVFHVKQAGQSAGLTDFA